MTHRRAPMIAAMTLCLQACSTIYTPPVWDSGTYADSTNVKAYVDKHIATYTRLMRQMGGGQDVSAVGIILAALVGTTAMALGAGTNVGILAGSAGAGISAVNGYAKPGDRLKLLGQALDATTCIRDEFSNQVARTQALGFGEHGIVTLSNPAISNPAIATLQAIVTENAFLSRQVAGAGEIAVDATRTVSTSLQVKLVNVSQVPDYEGTVKSIQAAQAAANANKPSIPGGGPAALLLNDISDYETRIQTCKAKLPS